jgi:hypothetical protein
MGGKMTILTLGEINSFTLIMMFFNFDTRLKKTHMENKL